MVEFQIQSVYGSNTPVVPNHQVVDGQSPVAPSRLAFCYGKGDVAPHHFSGQLLLRDLGHFDPVNEGPAPDDRAVVGYQLDFVQLVGNDDDRLALGGEIVDNGDQLFDLAGGQYRGGFIQDQNLGPAIECFENLDPLLAAHRNVLNQGLRIDGKPVTLGNLGHLSFGFGYIEKAQPLGGLAPQHNVLGHGKRFYQLKMLVNHADTVTDSHVGIADHNLLAVDADNPFGRPVKAVETIHQGCLTRPIFAQQRMHLAPVNGQADAVIGGEIAELLDDIEHFHGFVGEIDAGHDSPLHSGSGTALAMQ